MICSVLSVGFGESVAVCVATSPLRPSGSTTGQLGIGQLGGNTPMEKAVVSLALGPVQTELHG